MVPIRLILLFLLVVFSAFLVEKEKQSLLASKNSNACIEIEEAEQVDIVGGYISQGDDEFDCDGESTMQNRSTYASLMNFQSSRKTNK
jgi:hypothetical protein